MLFYLVFALQFFPMESEVSRVKRAHLLPKNQVREIVMYSDSDGEKYYTSEDTEDEGEPRPPS